MKLGIFGLCRGLNFVKSAKLNGVDVVAICDWDPKRIETALTTCPPGTATYSNFDEFIKHDMDAVVIANYFNEHAPYAIKAMENGKDVLCECTAAITLGECVELVEAVERTGKLYMLAENYPFIKGPMEMEKVYSSGALGRVLYSHGEYVHPGTIEDTNRYTRGEYHWRGWTPRTYYLTHSLGPIMHITKAYPKTITAISASAPELVKGTSKHTSDGIAIMMCNMSDGSISTFSGAGATGGRGIWYRIGCLDGYIETARGNADEVCLQYNSWEVPEGKAERSTYVPVPDGVEVPTDKYMAAGHGGSDYFVMKHFKAAFEGKEEPYFNVYRATQMSACAILGWRSVLENGKTMNVPDFTNKEDRELYRNDFVNPYPKADRTFDIPCCKQEYHPSKEELKEVNEFWDKEQIFIDPKIR
ncbi:MAG: Gfo/Idh/MocA family oxidoreductase [Clostridia bacterium]|nr:Gfo/Idh/MocA family oxidoreductase [Clostridia bacterium]